MFAMTSWVFVYFMIPETANKDISDILGEILGPEYKESQDRKASLHETDAED